MLLLSSNSLYLNKSMVDKMINEEGRHVHSSLVIPIIQKALSAYKRSHQRKSVTNTLMVSLWYDEECKTTKRSLKGKQMSKEI